VTFPHARVKTLIFLFVFVTIVELPALVLLGLWLLVQVVSALGVIGAQAGRVAPEAADVAWWAHIGGFAAGMLLMPMLSAGVPPAGTDWKKESDKFFQ
jgi:membrane associated rhomboid family serine protease